MMMMDGLLVFVLMGVLLAMGAGAFLVVRLMGAREVADDHPTGEFRSRREPESRDSSTA